MDCGKQFHGSLNVPGLSMLMGSHTVTCHLHALSLWERFIPYYHCSRQQWSHNAYYLLAASHFTYIGGKKGQVNLYTPGIEPRPYCVVSALGGCSVN